MDSLHTSVIIPTLNRPQAIWRCLDALAQQTMPACSFEVIVVDDGSTPPLYLDHALWSKKFSLRLIRQDNTGPAGARNRGVIHARGQFIAFTDDDCRPEPAWLARLFSALERTPGALVGGSTVNELEDNLFATTSQLIVDMVYGFFNTNLSNAYFFASNNMATRRSDYISAGGFDTDFIAPGAEDRDFCDRWRMLKRPLLWERSACINHLHQ